MESDIRARPLSERAAIRQARAGSLLEAGQKQPAKDSPSLLPPGSHAATTAGGQYFKIRNFGDRYLSKNFTTGDRFLLTLCPTH